ncbi:hypothetical protein EDF69_002038 [Sphingomonas sp. JUb134]|nr:hypothetical protein [Sphingomonas sp. JUb134]
MHVVAWLVSVLLCVASLIVSARLRAGLVIKLALGVSTAEQNQASGAE